jgi:5'-deoxynucleotidase YfbR-like HD superfamily hydrolase
MSFMITASGAEYHLTGIAMLDAKTRPVQIGDIAHHLSQINRFTGACKRPYSVAEHSLFVSEIAQRNACSLGTQLAALLHDAHEAYTSDLSTPAKTAVNYLSGLSGGTSAWSQFEDIQAKHVRAQLRISTAIVSSKTAVRMFDLQALATERRDLTAWRADTHSEWPLFGSYLDQAVPVQPIDWINLDTPEREAMTWKDWRQAFQDRYDEIVFGLRLVTGDAQ